MESAGSTLLVALLKYGFLALLFLFILFVVKTVAVGMRIPKGSAGGAGAAGGVAGGGTAARTRRAKPPKGVKVPAVVIVRTQEGKRVGAHKLAGSMKVGRAPECEIRPEDDFLSQFHARLFSKDGLWYVEDLGSTNGTLLDGQKVSGPVEVRAGDEVRLGRTVLQLRR